MIMKTAMVLMVDGGDDCIGDDDSDDNGSDA